jgi:hypothetical protein
MDRLGDVLKLCCAEIADLEIEARLHLSIGVFGQADRARLGDAFEERVRTAPDGAGNASVPRRSEKAA